MGVLPTSCGIGMLLNHHGTFIKIDRIFGYKENLNKFQRIEIIQNLFSDDSGIKLKIVTKVYLENSCPFSLLGS